MPDALSRPIAEIAALLADGKLKARALAEAAIANHERFGQGTRAPVRMTLMQPLPSARARVRCKAFRPR